MARFPEAIARLFKNVYVCKNCKTKMKANTAKVLNKELVCKKCGGRHFRPIKSKK